MGFNEEYRNLMYIKFKKERIEQKIQKLEKIKVKFEKRFKDKKNDKNKGAIDVQLKMFNRCLEQMREQFVEYDEEEKLKTKIEEIN